jgi:hypothetical protein
VADLGQALVIRIFSPESRQRKSASNMRRGMKARLTVYDQPRDGTVEHGADVIRLLLDVAWNENDGALPGAGDFD